MLRFRLLRTESERQVFLDRFVRQLARRSGGALTLDAPVERIAHCTRVVGIFDARGEMVGGYVINEARPLVLLEVVPPVDRAAWLPRVQAQEVCELNLIWRGPGLGHTRFALVVWPRIILDCITRGRRWILGSGYDNRLDRWYRALDPELLYEGPSTTSGLLIYVYAFTRARLVATYFASIVDDLVVAPWRRRRRPPP